MGIINHVHVLQKFVFGHLDIGTECDTKSIKLVLHIKFLIDLDRYLNRMLYYLV